MTALSTIAGMIPVAIGLGSGAETRAPMGTAIVGGMVTSTVLTLVVIPVVYSLLDDLAVWSKRRFWGTATADVAASSPEFALPPVATVNPPHSRPSTAAARHSTSAATLRLAVDPHDTMTLRPPEPEAAEGNPVPDRVARP
jgi:hypothetical protein